jgi:hypothetical protein
MDDVELILDATKEIRAVMNRNLQLDQVDQLRVENCMAMLQLTYIEWKRRNAPPHPPYFASVVAQDSNAGGITAP